MSISAILETHFGIKPTVISSLEGYESINYKVQSNQGMYVLKQHAKNEQEQALLLAEHDIMEALQQLEKYSISVSQKSTKGAVFVAQNNEIYRLLSFVEGDFLAEVQHTPQLLYTVGAFLANIDHALKAVYSPVIMAKETRWDLKHFKTNYTYLSYINDARDRALVDYFFLQFDEHVYPIQHQLRKQIIHNDANDWNVLCSKKEAVGIIDFGDSCYSWTINEVAIALTYLMMNKENPLDTAVPFIQGYQAIFPLLEQELELLYYLIAARLCTSVCNSAYSKTLKPDSEYITISEQPAWKLLRQWVAINPIKAKNVFRTAAGFPKTKSQALQKQLKKRDKLLSKALSLSYKEPIQMSGAAFQYMYDAKGNTILDAYNNIIQVGHIHPKIVRAGQQAMATLNTNTRYVYDSLTVYAEKLLARFPKPLNKIFFVNSGSAASDLAIRIAKAHSGKSKVLALEHGYHGNTETGIAISHYKYNQKGGGGQQAHSIATPMPKYHGSGQNTQKKALAYFTHITTTQIEEHLEEIAAFIAEPIMGCGGQVPLIDGYLKAIYPKIRAQGGVCISDEVQVGFGRLGSTFWGFQLQDVVPDIVVLGKPMGNGHPIAAVVTTTVVAESFENGPEFFSSFGGNPVSCAIGKAVLDVIEEEQLQEHAKVTGEFLKMELQKLQQEHPQVADIRGSGLFLGVELTDLKGNPYTTLAQHIKNTLRKRNILIGTDGPYNNVLKIKPPLVFSVENAATLAKEIKTILGEPRNF